MLLSISNALRKRGFKAKHHILLLIFAANILNIFISACFQMFLIKPQFRMNKLFSSSVFAQDISYREENLNWVKWWQHPLFGCSLNSLPCSYTAFLSHLRGHWNPQIEIQLPTTSCPDPRQARSTSPGSTAHLDLPFT